MSERSNWGARVVAFWTCAHHEWLRLLPRRACTLHGRPRQCIAAHALLSLPDLIYHYFPAIPMT
eukprot:6055563-Lingulodinium_polyedra.AAC.1